MVELTSSETKDTISALTSYNYVLLQISKSKIRTKKERQNAEYDIKVINNLIQKYKKILEVLK